MKKSILFICILTIMIQLVLVSPAQAEWLGNSTNNIVQGSIIAQDGDVFYVAEDNRLFKTMGNKSELFSQEDFLHRIKCINIWGEYVYYGTVYGRDSGCIVRVKKDGTEKAYIYIGSVYNMIVTSKYIFFCNLWDGSIRRIDISGKNEKILTDSMDSESGSTHFLLHNDKLYYAHYETNFKIISMNIDGTQKKVFSNQTIVNWPSYDMLATEEYIFTLIDTYAIKSVDDLSLDKKGKYLYRTKWDGSGQQKLFNQLVHSMHPTDEWLYIVFQNKKGLYRSDLNGKNLKKISSLDWREWSVLYVTPDYITNLEYIMCLAGNGKAMKFSDFVGIKLKLST